MSFSFVHFCLGDNGNRKRAEYCFESTVPEEDNSVSSAANSASSV